MTVSVTYLLTYTAGLFFSTYENTKDLFSRTLSLPDPLIHSSASAVAEMASCLVIAPAEVIKQNAQMLSSSRAADGRRSTSIEAFRHLARSSDGRSGGQAAVKRLFTGYTALVARNLPFTALQFPAFEHLRSTLWERRRRQQGRAATDEAGLLETGVIGGISAGTAGALAAFITTPSDVVKTRMMLFAGEAEDWSKSRTDEAVKKDVEATKKHQKKNGAWAVTKQVYAERGVRGLFRGGLFRSAWTALGSGLYLGTYDTAKVFFKRRKPELENVGL